MTTRPATTISKHSVLIAGHRTSISVEAAFWDALKCQADERAISVASLVAEIDAARGDANLSSAVRVHLFATCRGGSNRFGHYDAYGSQPGET